MAAVVLGTMTGALLPISGSSAAPAPVGNGFTVTPGDLAFILKQIKIAEQHAATQTPANPCGTLVGPGPNQIPDRLSAYGLRTVDGSCNNLFPGRETFATADQPFPRLTAPTFGDAEPITPAFPVGPPGPTSYKQKLAGNVVIDSRPRTISNLIVDQTSTNPAAIAAAEFPVRTQGNPGLFPCTTDPAPDGTGGVPANCVPSHQTLFIPNVTTDVGLSPPYNSLFTFFGQFFDHGVDQTVKSGGTVFIPLKADDPLVTLGPDGKPNTGDEVPSRQAFMVLTRAQNQPGADGVLGTADDVQNANNTDSPWVDQSQTYTSHASHQVFLRAYAPSTSPGPFDATNPASVATGKLLGGLPAGQTYTGSPDGVAGIGTWLAVKRQAHDRLGLELTDRDVTNIPMLATDAYGKFLPGPARGLPQYVTTTGLIEGDLAGPVPVPANVLHFDTPFLTDIAHNADPSPQDTDHNPATPPVPPVPDPDDTPSADFANQPPGTYDDEMLNAHFSCGDGRCNENIALSTIHQVFHSEHDRLVDDINNVLTSDTSPAGIAALADWKATGVSGAGGTGGYGYGERLFQAARFITEMEYQHLVFEEFARKVQPAVRPFHVYTPDINAAIPAEFAHAVYRFGHSMLDDDVARTNEDPVTGAKSPNDLKLLDAFLNPPAYFRNGTGTYTPQQAAGSVVMGSSDQVGNELDEFVTETLRNNLLGLPLDLPAINMTRARDAGVPSLNVLRRQIFADTNDGQLAPYTSWSDLGQHLKHPESLINFVAAYGRHPSIVGASTLQAKRDAARAIVDPRPATVATASAPATTGDVAPGDAADFMFGQGDWADVNGLPVTGVDDVDLWVGGLAEVANLGGGLLGSTFNYVFQNTLENLQDGDRLYYLNRTPGMNLRTQLEGNSFAELIQRNTDGTHSLKADAFATSDCKFELAHLQLPPGAAFTPTVADDPTSPCDESQLLLRKPDGTIQYQQRNTVDPPGINGQSVYNGTPAADRVFGGIDNDTFWGGDGNDVLEGNNGDDVALGGNGNDVVTDLNGADVQKGGPGNDALDAGPGDDIQMGGDGQDFINGGANDNESFAGPGNDYVIGGLGADAVFGDGGDDWIEGGSGQDLLLGDHGAPFFDDPAEVKPGNDIFIGQVGENDYDAEGGDDLMAQNAAIDRNAGAGGFDWAFHQYDTVGADDDMAINNNLGPLPIQVVVNRDRWQETEADSGSPFDDVIRGNDDVPSAVGGAGFTGCNVLDQGGVNRISGLNTLLPQPLTGDLTPVVAASAAGSCPLTGPIWGEGNILLGGAGNDTITGRGGDDIIDGDRALTVRISVRNPLNPAVEIGSTDLMEHQYLRDAAGNLTGPTLQAAVFAGTVDPGNLVNVREIASQAGSAPSTDTAVFAGPQSNYTVAVGTDRVTVTQTGANVAGQKASDGTDTLRNVEKIQFSDGTVTLAAPPAPTGVTATTPVVTAATPATANGSATVSWTRAAAVVPAATSQEIQVIANGTVVRTITGIGPNVATRTINNLSPGTSYTFQVRAVNAIGAGALSVPSNAVIPKGLPFAPTAVVATRGNALARVSWTAAGDGGSPITGYQIQIRTGTTVVRTDSVAGTATTKDVTGLTNGTAYNFRVRAITALVNATPNSPLSAASNTVTPATTPNAPVLGAVASGPAGGPLTAVVNWTPPVSTPTAPGNGGTAITNYRVSALNAAGTAVVQSALVGSNQRQRTFTFTTSGPYLFEVVAINAVGSGPPARSLTAVPAQ